MTFFGTVCLSTSTGLFQRAGKVQDLSNTIKAALNSWSAKRAESLSPFKYLMSILENAPCASKYNDERMLLENVLLLMPGPVI
jgi:hypothetical protein